MKKKYLNTTIILFIFGIILSGLQIIKYQQTGCVNTFRGAIACNEYALIGHIIIVAASMFGIIKNLE